MTNGCWVKKDGRELYSTYGEHNVFNSGAFNPLTRNLTTEVVSQKTHHCQQCERPMLQSCYDFPSPHHSYCPTWTTHLGKRVRCGERFALFSGGCMKHPRAQGYNEPLYRAAHGGEVDMSELDDPDSQRRDSKGETHNHAIFDKMVQDASESFLREYYTIPDNFYGRCYAELAKEEGHVRQAKGASPKSLIPREELSSKAPKKGKAGSSQGSRAKRESQSPPAVADSADVHEITAAKMQAIIDGVVKELSKQ